jgi:peroxiredoxin Q/BCP
MPTLEIGRSIPDITLEDSKGSPRRLKDLVRSWLVVYFYPKDMTPGCTTEACDFTDLAARFDALDVAVVGVSPDSVKSHASFIAKEKLGVELLADPPAAGGTPRAAESFGVWGTKSMYGRSYQGVIRSTFLVGRDGKVVKAWENVKVPGHAADVLAAVTQFAGGSGKAAPATSKAEPSRKASTRAAATPRKKAAATKKAVASRKPASKPAGKPASKSASKAAKKSRARA